MVMFPDLLLFTILNTILIYSSLSNPTIELNILTNSLKLNLSSWFSSKKSKNFLISFFWPNKASRKLSYACSALVFVSDCCSGRYLRRSCNMSLVVIVPWCTYCRCFQTLKIMLLVLFGKILLISCFISSWSICLFLL